MQGGAAYVSVIGHRGASGYRPEHTLESYRLAAEMGADFIEPDLVATKDGVLVARHEHEIAGTTDVADKFPDRVWRTEEFTLAELKTLRARERIPDVRPANAAYDGQFEIATFDEILELAAELGVAVYPETKHPSHFRALGLPLEEPLIEALRRTGVPAYIQSFEADSLRRIPAEFPRVQLTAQPMELAEVATYATAIGPLKELVTPEFVVEAHSLGLEVHLWTFRLEYAPDGDLEAELRAYAEMGVDAVFTDHPDIARRALGR